ncbi:putative phage head-tail adaptor [Selenomonas ruminantium subsp. lactilytica TAM6421]|uniref:Putative phage head-tail adaptor n=1 Tax=Selenomonas ruminantium subsp. lactilytica (strain NBRC 103574 / TAM6421) TaxID=927704 RepID=I0GRY8_SELRL|nr:phage head closure protein [Selenomonas ruminantium]BAL83525.1 putative phage head-tail adaptor [Selenomonas ruminantium subsp. lactilytica TAM6421]
MQIGRFKYRIEIQINTPTEDAEGNYVEEWQTVHTVWADITPVSSKQYFIANQDAAEVTCKIYIRYLADVTPRHRIVMKSHAYDIESVIPDIANGFCTIMAKEVF